MTEGQDMEMSQEFQQLEELAVAAVAAVTVILEWQAELKVFGLGEEEVVGTRQIMVTTDKLGTFIYFHVIR